jgi:hypothetical protein
LNAFKGDDAISMFALVRRIESGERWQLMEWILDSTLIPRRFEGIAPPNDFVQHWRGAIG